MSRLSVLLARETALAWGRGGGALVAVGFYAGVATLLPLAVGPELPAGAGGGAPRSGRCGPAPCWPGGALGGGGPGPLRGGPAGEGGFPPAGPPRGGGGCAAPPRRGRRLPQRAFLTLRKLHP